MHNKEIYSTVTGVSRSHISPSSFTVCRDWTYGKNINEQIPEDCIILHSSSGQVHFIQCKTFTLCICLFVSVTEPHLKGCELQLTIL